MPSLVEKALESLKGPIAGRLRVMARLYGLPVDYYFPVQQSSFYGVEDSAIVYNDAPNLSRTDVVVGSILKQRFRSDRSLDLFLDQTSKAILPPGIDIPLDAKVKIKIGDRYLVYRVERVETIYAASGPLYSVLILMPFETL